MRTGIYSAKPNQLHKGEFIKDELLAVVDLEVVPGGTYVIDGEPYTLVGRPTFRIRTRGDTRDELIITEIMVIKAT